MRRNALTLFGLALLVGACQSDNGGQTGDFSGQDGEGGYVASEPMETGLSVSSFGEGADGRIYLTDLSGGGVYELVPPL